MIRLEKIMNIIWFIVLSSSASRHTRINPSIRISRIGNNTKEPHFIEYYTNSIIIIIILGI